MNKIFNDLFVLEMANNHQGSLKHGLAIIDEAAKLVRKYKIHAGVKLQYRQLDSFVHPDYKDREDVKHIPRFMSTRLTSKEFETMIEAIHAHKILSIVTPFDEDSVDVCLKHKVNLLKVASCSATDWPLLEKIADAGKPIIASTGGLQFADIDNLVAFFEHKGVEFALMHCVSVYPTPNEKAQLSFMKRMKQRYPKVNVGYSGHEAPDNTRIGMMAIGAEADMLERHIGLPTKEIKLNAYSMNPKQLDKWLAHIKVAKEIIGIGEDKANDKIETDSLLSLQRGVFARKIIRKGKKIKSEDVFFAMPCQNGQATSGMFGQYRIDMTASKDYKKNEPIFEKSKQDLSHKIRELLHLGKGMINEAGIELGKEYEVELSHHYGLDRFHEVGCTIINLINREYCKKLIIVLPGQKHPSHRHKLKEETFQLLYGDLDIQLDDIEYHMALGDMMLVERGRWHSFESEKGAIFEEVSTTHHRGDSYYADQSIAKLDPMARKTIVDVW